MEQVFTSQVANPYDERSTWLHAVERSCSMYAGDGACQAAAASRMPTGTLTAGCSAPHPPSRYPELCEKCMLM